MPDSYPFPTYSGLLEPEHYKKIGSAIWLFLWCISSTTKEVERDGVNWGIVLGNKPMKKKEIAAVFGVNEKTVERWIKELEKHEYIKTTRAPHGLIFSLRNSKKYINKKDKNVVSGESDKTKMSVHSDSDTTFLSKRTDINVSSNKDITEINKKHTTTITKTDPVDLIAGRFADLRSIQEGRPIFPNAKDYPVIAQIVAQGVPVSRTIELLEQCFREFGERDPHGKIKAFSYCKDYILDHHIAQQAKEEAKILAKRRIPDNDKKHKRSVSSTPAKGESITGGQVGRIRRKKA